MTAGVKGDGMNVPIATMRALGSLEGLPVYALGDHAEEDGDPQRLVGRVLSSYVDDVGVVVRVMISKSEPNIWTKITEGILRDFSIFAFAKAKQLADGTKEAVSLTMRHLAIVVDPLDPGAQFAVSRADEVARTPEPVQVDTAHQGGGGGSVGGVGEACVLAGMAAVTGAAMLMAAVTMGEK